MKKIKLPKGFLANGIHSGLKKKRKDLTLLFSEDVCKCSAVFTRNRVKAAPVVFCQDQLKKSRRISAIIVNSGNANCMTGRSGMKDTIKMAELTAAELKIPVSSVLVSSTGVIGKPMKLGPIEKSMKKLVKGLSEDGLQDAAEGIMTTDSFAKISVDTFMVKGKKASVVGMTKGAGMIRPDMATTLCYLLTDTSVTQKALDKALKQANERSFNSITVDGDMSTNDTVVLLSNGRAGNNTINDSGRDFDRFAEAVKKVMTDLAKMIVRDGEGATKFIEIKIEGAKSAKEAKKAADTLANSLLLKCAVLGGDPNWGRVASSIGASGIAFDPNKMDVILDNVAFLKNGKVAVLSSSKKKKVFKGKSVRIRIDLKMGKDSAEVFTCDISQKYIKLNSYYTT